MNNEILVLKRRLITTQDSPKNDVMIKLVEMDGVYVVTSMLNNHDHLFSLEFGDDIQAADDHFKLIVDGLVEIRRSIYGDEK